MNIKQASEQSGVSAPNIRFYEKEGLLTPARRQGNDYRDYTAGNVRTLKLIRTLRMLDVPLSTIKAVLHGEQPLQQALQAQLDAQQQAVALARQDARKQIRQLLAVTHSKSAAEAVMQSLEGMELARLYQYKDALRRDFSRQCAAQLQPGEHAPLDSFRM